MRQTAYTPHTHVTQLGGRIVAASIEELHPSREKRWSLSLVAYVYASLASKRAVYDCKN